jgi:hypothetical protein
MTTSLTIGSVLLALAAFASPSVRNWHPDSGTCKGKPC